MVGWLWLRGEAAAEVTTAPVLESGAASGGGATVLNASGYVTARRQATVSSKVTGKVVEVRVEEGMAVRAGEVVARLDDATHRAVLELAESQLTAARSALEETRAQLRLAELTLERTARLVEEGVSGQADLDEAETVERAYRARLASGRVKIVQWWWSCHRSIFQFVRSISQAIRAIRTGRQSQDRA